MVMGVQGDLKKITVDNLDTYVHKDPQLPIVLDRFVCHDQDTEH